MSRMGIGSRSYEMAVKELVDGRFIDRQDETDYFLVNPRMVFRGSRMKVFQTEERRILFKKKV
jgi:cytochrome c2